MVFNKYLVILMLLIPSFMFSQTTTPTQVNDFATVQPTLVVVPFTTTGQDALNLYETKFEYRAIVNEINNAIGKRGSFMPQDLQEIISRRKENAVLNEINDVNEDATKKILDNITADILVKAEIYVFTEGGTNSVQLTLKAIDKASGKTLFASPLLTSPGFKTNDFAYLAQRVLNQEDAIGNFCTGVSNAFKSIAANGRSIQVIFETNSSSTFKLDDEDKDLNTFGDLIIDWVKKTSFKGYYKIRTQTSNQIYFEEIKIPIKDETGATYDINMYARQLRKGLSDICLQIKGGERPKIATPLISNGVIRVYLP
jgi:hypothetical protein